jgi:hypothetical protein
VTTLATTAQLALKLGVTLDDDRAQLALDEAEALLLGVVSPLPAAAWVIELRMAARAFPNPAAVAAMSAGGASASWPSPGGVYLSRYDKADLRRMANSGKGAFSVNTAPDAGKGYVDPLAPGTVDEAERFVLDQGIL